MWSLGDSRDLQRDQSVKYILKVEKHAGAEPPNKLKQIQNNEFIITVAKKKNNCFEKAVLLLNMQNCFKIQNLVEIAQS